ncbi:hypothetical protein C9374_001186 [Naegleria lovaniensis]|uniref:Uncharacterized protein n=1 Tax=Naegleria lovaniensis TaxID=51637 RepID=A0AA88GRM3_NAELO|nr:uncharacterized protein C9374_001186 [Naegleria lovaniensis]KAG2387592.1 hypothetical protein C9374_001186 [Naegleria lovaniensis]
MSTPSAKPLRTIPSLHELLHGSIHQHDENKSMDQPSHKTFKSQEQHHLPSILGYSTPTTSLSMTTKVNSLQSSPRHDDHHEIKVGQTTTCSSSRYNHVVPNNNNNNSNYRESQVFQAQTSTHSASALISQVQPYRRPNYSSHIIPSLPPTTTLSSYSSSPVTTTTATSLPPYNPLEPQQSNLRRIEELERELRHQANIIADLERENGELRRELQHVLSSRGSIVASTSSGNTKDKNTTHNSTSALKSTASSSSSPPPLPTSHHPSLFHTSNRTSTPTQHRYESNATPNTFMLEQHQQQRPSSYYAGSTTSNPCMHVHDAHTCNELQPKKIPSGDHASSSMHASYQHHEVPNSSSSHHQHHDSNVDHYVHYSSSSLHDRYHANVTSSSSSPQKHVPYSNEYPHRPHLDPHNSNYEMHSYTSTPLHTQQPSSLPQHLKRPFHQMHEHVPTFSTPSAQQSKKHVATSSTSTSESKKRKTKAQDSKKSVPFPKTISIVDESSDRENQLSDLELFKVKWKGEEYVLVTAFKNRTQILNYYVPLYQSQFPDKPCKIVLSNEDYKQLSVENPSNVEKKKHAWRVSVFTIDFYNFVKNLQQKSPPPASFTSLSSIQQASSSMNNNTSGINPNNNN